MAEIPSDLFASIPPSSRSKLDSKIDGDIHQIGERFTNWKGVAPSLGLSEAEISDVNNKIAGPESSIGVAALKKWKEKNGSGATYKNLAIAFNNAGRTDLVEQVCKLLGGSTTATAIKEEPKAGVNVLPTAGDDDTLLDEDDVFDVVSELTPCASKWRAIGIGLRLKLTSLETIEAKHKSNPTDCLSDMLTDWLRRLYNCKRHGVPSWKKVVEVVAHPAAGNNVGLACTIARKYKVEFTPLQVQEDDVPVPSAAVISEPTRSLPLPNCPVFDERPTMQELQFLRWNDNGIEKQIRVLDIIAPRWKDLGYSLNFQEHDVEAVELTGFKDTGRCVQGLFGMWFRRDSEYCWRALIYALERAKLWALAGDLRKALPLKNN